MQSIPTIPLEFKSVLDCGVERVLLSADFPDTTLANDGRITGEWYVSANGNGER
jgi:hypothetical protein